MHYTDLLTFLALAAISAAAAQPAGRADLSKLELKGNGMAEDSVALAVAAAGRVLGCRDTDRDRLWYLAGNAFGPVVNRDEDCASWWHVEAVWGDRGIDNVAAALGLAAARVVLPEDAVDMPNAESVRRRRIACLGPLRDAMADGAVLVALGWWEARAAHGFVPWGWAGIITEVHDDGTILGACLNGRRDNPLRLPTAVWAIRPGTAPAPALESHRRALRLGVARIRGETPFSTQGKTTFGAGALDAILLQMRTVPGFCRGCQEREQKGWTDALDNIRWLEAAARAAETGLKNALPVFPDAARPYLLTAATRYARMRTLLRPALSGENADRPQAFIGDLAKQEAFAEHILRPLRAELVLAAADMETALLAEAGGQPVVVPAAVAAFAQEAMLLPDLNPVRTDLLMRLVCMRAMGDRDSDYGALVVFSGWGNSFVYHRTKPWLVYQPPDDPDTTSARLERATGVGWETIPKASAEDCWKTLKETVDSGRPLQAPWLDDYIFAGYCDAPRADERRVFTLGGWREPGWMIWKDFVDWAGERGRFGRPTGKGTARDPRVDREVLERLAAWPNGDGRAEVASMKEGVFGIPGLEAYAADVLDTAKPPDAFDGGWLACHAVNRQFSGRAFTADWLGRQAVAVPPAVAARLLQAAAEYRASDRAWKQFRRVLGGPEGSSMDTVKALWADTQRRAAGADALRQAGAAERSAADSLAKAAAMLEP